VGGQSLRRATTGSIRVAESRDEASEHDHGLLAVFAALALILAAIGIYGSAPSAMRIPISCVR
jgi:hypothetical protein